MVLRLLLGWIAIAIGVWLTTWLLPGMDVEGGFGAYLLIAAVFGIFNVVIGQILVKLDLPLTIVTLGLVSLVVNAILLMVTAWLIDRLHVDNFFVAAIAAILISLVSTLVLALFVHDDDHVAAT